MEGEDFHEQLLLALWPPILARHRRPSLWLTPAEEQVTAGEPPKNWKKWINSATSKTVTVATRLPLCAKTQWRSAPESCCWFLIGHPAAFIRHSESAKEHFIIYLEGFEKKWDNGRDVFKKQAFCNALLQINRGALRSSDHALLFLASTHTHCIDLHIIRDTVGMLMQKIRHRPTRLCHFANAVSIPQWTPTSC